MLKYLNEIKISLSKTFIGAIPDVSKKLVKTKLSSKIITNLLKATTIIVIYIYIYIFYPKGFCPVKYKTE